MKDQTLAIHAGFKSDPTTKATAVPVYQTVAYEFDNAQHGADLFDLAAKSAGDQTTLLWQSAQISVVEIWVGCLPVASVPSWQLTQLPVIFTWSKLAGIQATVVWQSSQLSPLVMWVGCLPVDVLPS